MAICARCGNRRDAASTSCPHCEVSVELAGVAPFVPPPSAPAPLPEAPPTALPTAPPAGPVRAQRRSPTWFRELGRRMRAGLRAAFSRPPGYPNAFVWFVTGMLRDRRGLAGALLASWFNLPVAIALGGLGLVAGGIIGFGGGLGLGNEVLPSWIDDVPIFNVMMRSALIQSGGVLGVLLGAAIGAVAGFLTGLLLPWLALVHSDPFVAIGLFLGQLIVAVLVGVLYTVYRVAIERVSFQIAGTRRPSRRELELIMPVLVDCGKRLGLGTLPPLLMDDSREPNAYAGARHIVVTRGFLDEFNYDIEPLAGVLCHELTHWRNADAISGMFVRGVALPLYLTYNAVTWLAGVVRGGFLQTFLLLVAWPLLVCIRFVVMPMQAAGSRAAEYRADQGAVFAGHRQGLRRALARFRASFDGARNGWEESVCASHPPNELRLEAIEEKDAQYTLPDTDGPAIPLPVVVTGSVARD